MQKPIQIYANNIFAFPFDKTKGCAYNNKEVRGVAQLGSASGLGPEGRRFESCHPDQPYGSLAQLGERLPYKQDVTGSSPVTPTNLL